MGYYWRATLDASPEAIADLRSRSRDARDKLDEAGRTTEGELSWAAMLKDLRELSTRHDEAIILHGEGEEAGDVFKVYARGGQIKRVDAEIVHGPPPVWFLAAPGKVPDVPAAVREIAGALWFADSDDFSTALWSALRHLVGDAAPEYPDSPELRTLADFGDEEVE